MFTLEYLPAMLPKGVRIYGIFDSVMWIDMEPLLPGAVSLRAQTEAVLKMTNASARLGTLCDTTHTAGADKWKCLFGEFRAPTLRQPFLISASQYDSFQLSVNIGDLPPYNDMQQEYANKARMRTREAMHAITGTASIFSPACLGHCIAEESTFWTRQVVSDAGPNVSLADVLFEFVRNGRDSFVTRSQAVETCGMVFEPHCGCCDWHHCGRCNASRFERVGERTPC